MIVKRSNGETAIGAEAWEDGLDMRGPRLTIAMIEGFSLDIGEVVDLEGIGKRTVESRAVGMGDRTYLLSYDATE